MSVVETERLRLVPIYAFLPDEPWVREAQGDAHARWLEIGWALRHEHWGHGYASEIGRAGLTYAFDVLAMQAVVSCTLRHNERSRAVMQRIGMTYAGEITSNGDPYAVHVLLRS